MKYFTKEELEDITKELVENPTRETLKKLNDKYNVKTEEIVLPNRMIYYDDTPTAEDVPVAESQNNEVAVEATSASVMPTIEVPVPTIEQPVVNPIPNFNNLNTENNKLSSISTPAVPNLVLPQMNATSEVKPNTEMVNFTGNLFDSGPQMSNLMQTTDNFNSVPNTMPTTEVPITNTPFFGPHIATENNPIPVSGPINSMPVNEPSMFGQIAQNYM